MTAKARISAINRFISGCKADGIYNDLQAACVMAGWDGLAGALTPLVGASPTNNGFLDADLDRGIGLTGDGSSYVDSNYAYPAALQDDCHMATYVSAKPTTGLMAGYGDGGANGSSISMTATRLYQSSATFFAPSDTTSVAFRGVSRDNGAGYVSRAGGTDETANISSIAVTHLDLAVFARQRNTLTPDGLSDGTLSFYSIGSATDLEALDARVSQLMADLRAIEEDGFDADAVAYIRNVETADSAYLETSVKTAINRLVVGLKKDGLWESLKASCLLCGPRTLAGALVPLRGVAPTAVAFTDGDYSRSTGLTGDGATTYLDSNRANDDDPQDDAHLSVYATSPVSLGANSKALIGTGQAFPLGAHVIGVNTIDSVFFRSNAPTSLDLPNAGRNIGFYGVTRNSSSAFTARIGGSDSSLSVPSTTPAALNSLVFARLNEGTPASFSDSTLAFYSIGTSVDLELLDSHVSNYVTAIGASV